MRNQILFALVVLMGTMASAKDLSPQDIRERYQLNADVYTVDGKRIISGPEATNSWKPNRETGLIKGDWSSDSGNRQFALRYRFQVLDDNSVQAEIEEYGSQSPTANGPGIQRPFEQKAFTLVNLEPVV